MATRGTIFTKINDEYVGIYNHYDSFPEDLGKVLKNNYNTYEKVLELIAKGDSSYIGETLEDSKFYADHGEPNKPDVAPTLKVFVGRYGQDYNYFFDPATENWEIH